MQASYTQPELDRVLAGTPRRAGWDFSRVNSLRQPVPWEYREVVARYARPGDEVLDIGTGGGEMLGSMAGLFRRGLGIDIDPEMARQAEQSRRAANLRFAVCDAGLEAIRATFPLILNRHAELDLEAIAGHLAPGGYFITQQVGERNMACIRSALGQPASPAPVSRDAFAASGLRLTAFGEYDVEYVVRDIESLVFWLSALDLLHADLDGAAAVASASVLNSILAGNTGERGFVTNEHRYLAIGRA